MLLRSERFSRSSRRRKVINWRLIDFSLSLPPYFFAATLTTLDCSTFFSSPRFALFPWKWDGKGKDRVLPRIVIIIYNSLQCMPHSRKDDFRSFFFSLSCREWHWLSFIIKRAEKARASQQKSTWGCFFSFAAGDGARGLRLFNYFCTQPRGEFSGRLLLILHYNGISYDGRETVDREGGEMREMREMKVRASRRRRSCQGILRRNYHIHYHNEIHQNSAYKANVASNRIFLGTLRFYTLRNSLVSDDE